MPKPETEQLTAEQRLARSKLAADVQLKRIDQRLAREQFEFSKREAARTGLSALLTPTGAVFVAATLGLIGTAIGKYADNANAKRQQETSVILKASEVPATLSPEAQSVQRARNLLWFSRAHYVDLPADFEKQLNEDAKLQPGETLSAPVIETAGGAAPLASVTCDNSAALVQAFEGFTATIQDDPSGTGPKFIGYGHLLTPRELREGKLVIDGSPVAYAGGITEEQASRLLQQDMAPAYATVDRLVKVDITPKQRQALASFVWNVGKSNFEQGSILKHINEGNFDAVPDDLARWSKANGQEIQGLKVRRATEAAIWRCKP